MDFLDPRKKSSRRRRVIISYSLMGLIVIAGALALIYSSLGYGVDTKTGQIVQNGLVFIGSQPTSAEIFVNGHDIDKSTPSHSFLSDTTHITLPAGRYTISLKKSGYRTWQRRFSLDYQTIVKLNYGLMIPAKLSPESLARIESTPVFISQSPDQHWLLVATDSPNLKISQFDTTNLSQPATNLTLPGGLATLSGGKWQARQWSSDNKSLLIEHTSGAKHEFIVVNRSSPAKSFNLNKALGFSPDQLTLRNGQPNQFYVYRTSDGLLQSFNSSNSGLTTLLHGVLAFEPLGQNDILYSTKPSTASSVVLAKIWNGSNSYSLASLKQASSYLLAAATYQNHDYYAVGAAGVSKVDIYKDPLSTLQSNPAQSPALLTALNLSGVKTLAVSPGSRFITAEADANLKTYDFDAQQQYGFKLLHTPAQPVVWVDDYRLSDDLSGHALIVDYDGSNQQLLGRTDLPSGAYFDPAYHTMFTGLTSSGGLSLESTNLSL